MPSRTARQEYHHGNLAEALVIAATQLVAEHGPENFNLADASRLAGVSKGAPYRHFANKEALLAAVLDRGFARLALVTKAATEQYAAGSDAGISALGLAYVQFAVDEPEVFRLMFGGAPDRATEESSRSIRTEGFDFLLSQVAIRTGLTDRRALIDVARPLWALVHGAAMLTIDNSYQRIDPDGDTAQMVLGATALILAPWDFTEPVA